MVRKDTVLGEPVSIHLELRKVVMTGRRRFAKINNQSISGESTIVRNYSRTSPLVSVIVRELRRSVVLLINYTAKLSDSLTFRQF